MENPNRPASGCLHHAVATGDIEKVQSLLKQGVDVDTKLYFDEDTLERASRISMNSIIARKNTTCSEQIIASVDEQHEDEQDKINSDNNENDTIHDDIDPLLVIDVEDDDESGYETLKNNASPVSHLIPLKDSDNTQVSLNNNRKSMAESIDERLNDDNETLIERRPSVTENDNICTNSTEMLSEEKPLKLIPRIKRKISIKWNHKSPKKGEREEMLDEEDFYENIRTKVRNVDDEQLNENYEGIAFFEAVREGMEMIVQTLLETSDNYQLNLADKHGFSPVMQAAWHGQKDCLQILLEHGANTSLKNGIGCTAAHFAAGQGHTECLELLIEDDEVDVDTQTKFGATALILAAKGGHQEAVELLLEHGADPNIKYRGNQNALLFAAGNGHYDCIQALIAHNVFIDQANSQNVTPLMRAIQQGHNTCVVLLIDNKANIDLQDVMGRRAIHFAVEYDNPKGLKILIENGANIEAKTKGGSTPLMYAERFEKKKCADILENQLQLLKEKIAVEEMIDGKRNGKKVTCMNFRRFFRQSKLVKL